MFFILSKLVWFLIQPLVAVALVVLLGIVLLLVGYRNTAMAAFVFSGVTYAVIMFSPLGLLLVGALEDRFPKPTLPARIDGIVVLGGSFDTRVAKTRGDPEMGDAGDRITATVALARQFPDAKIAFTGGVAAVFEDDIAEVEVARQIFAALGIAPERLILEGKARNTTENAIFTKELVQPKPGETWLLVTSAFHMPRSVGCFRKADFEVVPFPVDYRTPNFPQRWKPAVADVSRNADKVQLAIREFIGLAAYYASGKTDALIPSPSAEKPSR